MLCGDFPGGQLFTIAGTYWYCSCLKITHKLISSLFLNVSSMNTSNEGQQYRYRYSFWALKEEALKMMQRRTSMAFSNQQNVSKKFDPISHSIHCNKTIHQAKTNQRNHFDIFTRTDKRNLLFSSITFKILYKWINSISEHICCIQVILSPLH